MNISCKERRQCELSSGFGESASCVTSEAQGATIKIVARMTCDRLDIW
jgi:hypothetical protein